MTAFWVQALFLIHLSLFIHSWDVEYVGHRIVVPRARLTQELLYCVCEQCRDERLDQVMQWAQLATMHPQLMLTANLLNTADNFQLRRDNHKRNMFTLVLARTVNDSAFELQDQVLRGRHYCLIFVVMYEPIADFGIVEQVLRQMQRRRFISADVYYRNASTGRNEIFGYANYPRFALQNKTAFVEDLHRFYAQLFNAYDAQGYEFGSPILQDAPNVIKYVDRAASGGLSICGTSYGILKLFVEYINGTLIEHGRSIDEVVDMRRVLNMVRAGEIEVAAHAYALFESDERIDKSYPLSVVNWCLMVPVDYSISTMYYTLLPYEPPVWIAAICTFIIFNAVNGRWLRRCELKSPNFPLLHSLCQFIHITPPRSLEVGPLLNVFFQACVFLHSFFLSTVYAAMLGSVLTVTIVRDKINSIADLVALQLPVMIINYELEFLMLNDVPHKLPLAFRALLRPVSYATFHRHQLAWNTSFAYFVTGDKWRFLDLQQRFFGRRVFKLSDICFGSYHQAFPMAPDSPLWRDLEYFLYRVHASGLHFYHESKAFDFAVWAGILQRLKDANYSAFESVGIQHLRIVFYLHGCILLVSIVCFLTERFGHIRWRN